MMSSWCYVTMKIYELSPCNCKLANNINHYLNLSHCVTDSLIALLYKLILKQLINGCHRYYHRTSQIILFVVCAYMHFLTSRLICKAK